MKQDGKVSKRDFVKPTLKKEASLVEVTLSGSGAIVLLRGVYQTGCWCGICTSIRVIAHEKLGGSMKQDGQVSKRDFVRPTLKKEASLVEVTLSGSPEGGIDPMDEAFLGF